MSARAEIANLIARLAHVSDHGDLAELHDLYTADATWEYTAGPVNGAERIIANAQASRDAGRVGPSSGLRHVVTTVSVTFRSDDIAESESYILVYAAGETPPVLRSMVCYHDTCRREATGWRVAGRLITRC